MRNLALASLSLLALAATFDAQTPLTTTRLVTGLSQPVYVCAPEGDERLFIVQQGGIIRIFKDGALLPTPFLNISSSVSSGGECGLLGMAFHPEYRDNGKFYLHYSASGCNSRIFEYHRSTSNPDVADPTGTFKFNHSQPFSNHNGGCLQFGPDGYLYTSLGDGGSGGDPGCRAQNLANMWGTILRIDINGTNPGTAQYLIPPTNPFVSDPNALDEIFHYGLRNSWRFSFDRLTGDMYIGDVGQNGREEIDVAPAGSMGLNFGWKIMEGTNCYSTAACAAIAPPACNDPSLILPVRQENYGTFTSITGGYVYRGCAIPDLQGTYFYADYNTDIIRSFQWDSATNTALNLTTRTSELAPGAGGGLIRDIASFGEDGFGELLIVDRAGEIYKIIPASTPVGLVDCDNNGKDDNCELATIPWSDLDSNGMLDACQSFSARYADISASAQTSQDWFMHAGPANAGALYLVAGSFSGTSPGFTFGGVTIPLNVPDIYFNLTLANPNSPPLVNSLGALDAQGMSTGAFDTSLMALPPALIGSGADHAFATLSGGVVTFVSNPIHVNFLP